LIGWFEVQSGVGFKRKTELFQIKEIQRDKKQMIQIEHLMSLESRKKYNGNVIGDEIEISISQKKIKLFNCSKPVFWLEEKQTVAKVRQFSSKEAYQKALKTSFSSIKWCFDQ